MPGPPLRDRGKSLALGQGVSQVHIAQAHQHHPHRGRLDHRNPVASGIDHGLPQAGPGQRLVAVLIICRRPSGRGLVTGHDCRDELVAQWAWGSQTPRGAHPDVDAHYRPRRIAIHEALATIGAEIDVVRLAANCHLHFDHCGGNPALKQIPVFVQDTELGTARRTQDYTLPELIEGTLFETISGRVEVLPGVFLIPTPGHTKGHQSLIVRQPDGAVIVAGQSHDTATQYAADQLAWRAQRDAHGPPLPAIPDWIEALQQFDPRMVCFAHDRSVWIP